MKCRLALLGCVLAVAGGTARPALAGPPPSPLPGLLSNRTPWGGGPLPGAGACDETTLDKRKAVSLPADDAPHTADPANYWEWWYWTGHFKTEPDDTGHVHEFAFAVYFESKPHAHIQQAAYTLHDLREQKMHYGRQPALVGDPAATRNGFALRGPHSFAIGHGDRQRLHEEVDGYVLDVNLDSVKSALLHFGDGTTSLYCMGVSYYQRQRMVLTGSLRKNGRAMSVRGLGWGDHQWGFTAAYQVAQSDYLQFQLNDGTDIFLGLVRVPPELDAPVAVRLPAALQAGLLFGSVSDPHGRVTLLHPDDITLTATDHFRPSPTCSYPIAFDVGVQGKQYHVAPALRDGELRSTATPLSNVLWQEDATVWDAPTTVTGDGTGVGWLGLVRYCYGR